MRNKQQHEIILLIDNSMDRKVVDELYRHILSLVNLLQGYEETYIRVIQKIPTNTIKRKRKA